MYNECEEGEDRLDIQTQTRVYRWRADMKYKHNLPVAPRSFLCINSCSDWGNR